jgi:nucleotide-binding universal stress UspA family protein
MVTTMKVLVGYDGSPCSDAAVADLRHAGLPARGEARVVTVANVWPQASPGAYELPTPEEAARLAPAARAVRQLAADAMGEARAACAAGAAKVRAQFPQWNVTDEAVGDWPHHGLLAAAERWRPDLLVVGSYGRSGVGRMLFGSVSQAALTHSRCSVRVGRCAPDDGRAADAPVKVAVGVDGSVDSAAAVSAVAARHWPAGSAALVLVAVDLPLSMALAGVGPPVATLPPVPEVDGHAWAKRTAEAVERELQEAGLAAMSVVRHGDPKRVLVEEAEQWGADCIFVGAQGHGRVEKFFLGSVSAAVAARAHCSVEVVRQG